MSEINGRINGSDITSCGIYYENLLIYTADGNQYFLKPSEVMIMANEFIFDVELKKTRTWFHPVVPDVPLLYHQDAYPEKQETKV